MDDTPDNPPEDEVPWALQFTPISFDRVRPDGWTERRQRDFITALAAMGSVLHAARAVGMSKRSAYQLRNRADAESFAKAWDAAQSVGYDKAFDQALERATMGITTPRFYRGKQVGTLHRIDWRLAMAALNSSPPTPPQPRKNVAR